MKIDIFNRPKRLFSLSIHLSFAICADIQCVIVTRIWLPFRTLFHMYGICVEIVQSEKFFFFAPRWNIAIHLLWLLLLFASSLQFVNNSEQNFLFFWFMKCALPLVCLLLLLFFLLLLLLCVVVDVFWCFCDVAISFTWSGDIERVQLWMNLCECHSRGKLFFFFFGCVILIFSTFHLVSVFFFFLLLARRCHHCWSLRFW